MRTDTVSVDLGRFGFVVRCSHCGLVNDDARLYVGADGIEEPTYHARYKASEAMQRHMC